MTAAQAIRSPSINRAYLQVSLSPEIRLGVGGLISQLDLLPVWPSVYNDSPILDLLQYAGAPGAYTLSGPQARLRGTPLASLLAEGARWIARFLVSGGPLATPAVVMDPLDQRRLGSRHFPLRYLSGGRRVGAADPVLVLRTALERCARPGQQPGIRRRVPHPRDGHPGSGRQAHRRSGPCLRALLPDRGQ